MQKAKSQVAVFVRGGVVQEVYADDADVFLIDIDESDFAGGPHEWNIGRFPVTPLSKLKPETEELSIVSIALRGLVNTIEA
jgi:hypothetical protein